MTLWDLLYYFYEHGGILWTLVFILVALLVWLIAHPSVVKEWNTQITIWIAALIPKKRKKAFEKKINLTMESARRKTGDEMPGFMSKFLPYDLKVKWIDETDTLEAVTRQNQIVVFVPNYKDEMRQIVGVLHSYCREGFARKAKIYMPEKAREASDVIVTKKLAQNAGNAVFDYYNREYMPEILKKNPSYRLVLEQLQRVDRDGLFIPLLLNEIDKYANIIYPSDPSPEIYDRIMHLMNFVYTIATRQPQENVPLLFCEEEIRIKVILAVSTGSSIRKPILEAEKAIRDNSINTIYILATGTKIAFAKTIAKKVYENNIQSLYEPKESHYKRYSRSTSGMESVCYEINLR